MTHFAPSKANLEGFFPDSAAGFVGLAGRLGELALVAGTVLDARSSGFLCVISDLSTLRKPFVTSTPLFRSAKTAPNPPPAEEVDDDAVIAGGGGGGGGAPADAEGAAN